MPTSPTASPQGTSEADWAALRGNVAHLGEIADWLPVLHGDIASPEVVPDDKPLLAAGGRNRRSSSTGRANHGVS